MRRITYRRRTRRRPVARAGRDATLSRLIVFSYSYTRTLHASEKAPAMANPEHVAVLDGLDRLTVRLYRTGLFIAAIGLLLVAVAHRGAMLDGHYAWTRELRGAWFIAAVGTALVIYHIHLYDKNFRWLIPGFGWTGLVLMLGDQMLTTPAARPDLQFCVGLGLTYVALSAVALKERLCFKIFGMRAVPLVLALAVFATMANSPLLAGLLHGVSGTLYLWLAVSKARMPLHFDIGDKSSYQV